MTVTALDTHPVPACVQTAREAFGSLDTEAWSGLETGEVRRLVGEIARLESQIAAHKMAASRQLDRAGAARRAGASSTGDLLARDFGGDRRAGDALVRSAHRIQRETTHTEGALARGDVSPRQADVVAQGMAKLPQDVTAEQRELAERALLKDAQRLTLKDLQRRTDRVSDTYRTEPTEVDEDEDRLLTARERAARAKTELALWDNRDGTYSGRFTIAEAQGVMLKTALDALAAPHQSVGAVDAATGEHHEVGFGDTYPQRLGLVFGHLLELLPADRLPSNGGVSAVITVNLDLETLVGGVKAAGLSDGTRISAGEARRLACSAALVPLVLDGESLPLDLGTTQRYFNRSSRRAMERRDGGCTAPGCDRDARWCESHHLTPYSISETTDIRDGALLCSFHHHRVHDQQWHGRISPGDGHVEWRRPGRQIWERNSRWRP